MGDRICYIQVTTILKLLILFLHKLYYKYKTKVINGPVKIKNKEIWAELQTHMENEASTSP